jgi:hypothetical protein
MVPAGEITESTVKEVAEVLDRGDAIIDGGNSYFKDDVRRAEALKAKKIHYLDAGHLAKGCPTSDLPRVPLPPLPDARHNPPKPPVHSRLIFPPDHHNSRRQPVHTRL